jgi:hypothetical protein
MVASPVAIIMQAVADGSPWNSPRTQQSPEEQPVLDFLVDAAAGCFLIVFFVMLGYSIGYIPRFLLTHLFWFVRDLRDQPPDRER